MRMIAMQREGRPTKPEKVGYAILDSLAVGYLPQHVIGDKFCVDAFVPRAGVVVQFDGDYRHGNPSRFPDPDPRRIRLDRSQDAYYMEACGYSVVRVWASDLLDDPGAVASRLSALLEVPPVEEFPSPDPKGPCEAALAPEARPGKGASDWTPRPAL